MPNLNSALTASCSENAIPESVEYTTVEEERAMLEKDPEKKKRVAILEENLQKLLDEQARSLGCLIEETVRIHKAIKEDVAKMWEQDREEDQLVEQSKIKTQMLEKELLRHNPTYEAFRDSKQGNSSTQCSWMNSSDVNSFTSWDELITLTPEMCSDLMDIKKGVKDITCCPDLLSCLTVMFDKCSLQTYSFRVFGESIHDLSLSNASDSRDLLGLAVSLISNYRTAAQIPLDSTVTESQVQFVATNIRVARSNPSCNNPHELLFRLLCSPVFIKYLTPSVIHSEPLPIALVPMSGECCRTYLRLFIIKGTIRLVEERLPHVYPGTGVTSVDRNSVVKFIKKFQESSGQPETCVIDVMVSGGETSIEWVHKMNCDMVQVVPWEDFCSMAQKSGEQTTFEWVAFPHPKNIIASEGGEAVQSRDAMQSILVSEAPNLIPSKSCWSTSTPHSTFHLLTRQPLVRASQNSLDESGRYSSTTQSIIASVGTSIAFASIAFATGYMLSGKKK